MSWDPRLHREGRTELALRRACTSVFWVSAQNVMSRNPGIKVQNGLGGVQAKKKTQNLLRGRDSSPLQRLV